MQRNIKQHSQANADAIADFLRDNQPARYAIGKRAIRAGQIKRADQYAVKARGYSVQPIAD